jgi:hypothetical protein
MELNEILEKMVNFDQLVEPNEMVQLSSHIGEYITDFTLQYDQARVAYSVQWEKVKYTSAEKPLSDKVTEMRMLRDPSFIKLMELKRQLGELKRYRSDLNRRIDVILGIKRRN